MGLVELSMLDQRYLAVREVLDTGATVTDVAARHGVDRRTLHRWLLPYATEGIGALTEKSSKPDRCPHQLSPVIEARIVSMRTVHPAWGPRTILTKLRKEAVRRPRRGGEGSSPGLSLLGHDDLLPREQAQQAHLTVRSKVP